MTDPRRNLANDAVQALCWGPTEANQDLIIHALKAALGALLELTVRSKTICLLAAHLHSVSVPALDHTAARFLDSTLRTNRYKTHTCRQAALAATAALRTANVPTAVLGGMSVEYALYASTGARQFSDIDLLIAADDLAPAQAVLSEQGYVAGNRSGKLACETGDPIVPLIVLDLATTLPGSTDDDVAAVLARRTEIPLPQHDRPLPVLAPADALDHTLARVGAATTTLLAEPRWALLADAIRCSRLTAPRSPHHADVLAGWAALQSHWPLLPAAPTRLPTTVETNR